jgi:hypothetical protein
MKTITKIGIASALALLTAAPGFAYETDAQTNTQVSATRAQHVTTKHVNASRATDSFAFSPADAPADYGSRYFNDFGIGSQS